MAGWARSSSKAWAKLDTILKFIATTARQWDRTVVE